jgi:hypothetical protein
VRRYHSPAEFFRAWADAVLALRRAEDAVREFGFVVAYTHEDEVQPLGDPSFDDLERDTAGVELPLQRALRLFDNCTPPPVSLLTGGLAAEADDTPRMAEAKRQVRKIAREKLAAPLVAS